MRTYPLNSCNCGPRAERPPVQYAAGEMIDARFPVAMSYVPWQSWKETFDCGEALKQGTIFPELCLPFLGSANRRGNC